DGDKGVFFFFSSRRRHTRFSRDWSSDVCSSDLGHDLRQRARRMLDDCTGEAEADIPPDQGIGGGKQPFRQLKRGEAGNVQHTARSEERRVGKECRERWSPQQRQPKK